MEQQRLKQLTGKYHKGTLSDNEKKELNEWFHSLNLAAGDFKSWINEAGGQELLADSLYTDFSEKLVVKRQNNNRNKYKWFTVAASVLLCAGLVLSYYKKPAGQQKMAQTYTKPILPGGNNAILTLSNGRQIVLSATTKGKLASQGNTIIKGAASGGVVYKPVTNSAGSTVSDVQYNTLTTPLGGQHMLTLSDGTRVWLNAASSIKFPVEFSGTERVVEITGEVYFEVKHNAKMPFRVITRGEVIEDLGTQFNVNAYNDEPAIKTTLVQGKVRVVKNSNSATLVPGEQSTVSNNNNISIVKADTTLALAWKNGLFKFHNADLAEVMRQLARWYNVKVMLKDGVSDRLFSGEITRDVNMADVFEILSFLKVNFHAEQQGGQVVIVVYPK